MSKAVEIAIVASAFGADAVRASGHRKWAEASRRAGAAGFEVRRELFCHEADAAPDRLAALGEQIAQLGLWSVYSSPASLYADDGQLDGPALRRALDEAAALGARFVKLQLGGFVREAHGDAIAAQLRGVEVRLVAENGQLTQGGSLRQFVDLFAALENEGHAGLIGMTFDVGNWAWCGVPALDAALALAPYVEYVHCKSAAGEGARRFAAAPAADDARFAAVLKQLPRDVPRGIEFPLDATCIDEDATRRVAWLAAA
ncbi:sugar phosphate isomerase/epimerase family protein [Burkholderia sp. WSM2232]|uniref:sugar phosphate isomerase/epimerase family protein n=1 Tax=Burkholderia sp. WSM2232 TaxID=944436 RepID=UPI0003F65ABA|nr:TIM barrel protein [Burkholderia sp. WSM2232]